MTDDQLTALERALSAALDTGDEAQHRRVVGATLLGIIREKHADRVAASAMAATIAERAKAVDARLERMEHNFSLMGDIAELAQTARAIVGWCSRRAANIRAAALWLTPVLAFVAALAAARATLSEWGAELLSHWRR